MPDTHTPDTPPALSVARQSRALTLVSLRAIEAALGLDADGVADFESDLSSRFTWGDTDAVLVTPAHFLEALRPAVADRLRDALAGVDYVNLVD